MATVIKGMKLGMKLAAPNVFERPFYPLAVLTVNTGDTVRMTMTLENNTESAAGKDLLAAYGSYDASTGTFTMSFAGVKRAVSIPTGSSSQDVDCVASVVGTDFDAFAAVGIYNETDGTFTIESDLVKTDQLTVTGIAVTDFTLSKV